VWDQEPDTSSIAISPQLTRRYPEIQSRTSRQSDKLSQLKKKIGSLEVIMQQMHLEREPTPELEEKDLEAFLKKMAAEYV